MSQKNLNINGKIFSFFVCNYITYSIDVNDKFINSCFTSLTSIFIRYFLYLTNEKIKLKHIDADYDFSQFVLEKNLISMDESLEEYTFSFL